MYRFFRLPHGLTITICLIIVVASCTQHDDVVRPQNYATLHLQPQYLPALTDRYTYQLWALRVADGDTAFTSLRRFVWDSDLYLFRDETGAVIGDQLELPDPYYSYSGLAVTVENRDDAFPSRPSGVIMLTDNLIDPTTRPIILRFPVSLFSANGAFIVGTPTDDTVNTENEDRGIWLCTRSVSPFDNNDTLAAWVDSIRAYYKPDDPDSLEPDILGIANAPAGGDWPVDTVYRVFSCDTVPHRRIEVVWESRVVPDTTYQLFVSYEIDSITVDPAWPRGPIPVNIYAPSLYSLPDIAPYGWRYQAWVFGEYFPATEDFPEMVPFGYPMQSTITACPGWRVLPLGAFRRADSADYSNRYNDNREVPNYPGEDFLINIPAAFDDLSFRLGDIVDSTGGGWGSIVVGVEPDPALVTIDSVRNFPIFFLAAYLSDMATPEATGFLLHNYSQCLPEIKVTVDFHK